MTVAIGGHFQTSGQGHMHNKFGTFNQYVIGYDMILVNGTDVHVDRNDKDKDTLSEYVDKALRYGQSPGSWGVITKIRIKTLRDNDYKTSIFYSCDWQFNKDVLAAMMYVLKEYYESDDDKYKSYGFYLRICKGSEKRYGNIIRWRANYVSESDADNDGDIYIPFNKFIDAANKYSDKKKV